MSLEEILIELEKKTDMSREDLMKKIEKKQTSLSGLVSEEGAAHLVAKEFGLDLLDKKTRKLEIKNIVSGMKNVNVVGRIFRISNIIGFKRQDGTDGKVVNIFLADQTGYVRVPLWNDQVKLVEEETIKTGDVIQVVNGMGKENVFGDVEVSLGKFGSLRPVENEIELPAAEELMSKFLSLAPRQTRINNITQGSAEIKGNVVNLFRSNFLFDICPSCGMTLSEAKCPEHGEVDSKKALVVSCEVDDGTGVIRTVFFRDMAERICNITTAELADAEPEKRYEMLSSILGKSVVLTGKVRKSKISDNVELIANDFKELNPLEESKQLIDEIQLKLVSS